MIEEHLAGPKDPDVSTAAIDPNCSVDSMAAAVIRQTRDISLSKDRTVETDIVVGQVIKSGTPDQEATQTILVIVKLKRDCSHSMASRA